MLSKALSSKGRTLSTARQVLRVLRFLQEHPEGVNPRGMAFWIGKSLHAAYYLLNTLCQRRGINLLLLHLNQSAFQSPLRFAKQRHSGPLNS